MKYLKDLDMNQLKIQELLDYTEMAGVDLDKELRVLLEIGAEKLYTKYVPASRREMIDFKIKKSQKEEKSKNIPKSVPLVNKFSSSEPNHMA